MTSIDEDRALRSKLNQQQPLLHDKLPHRRISNVQRALVLLGFIGAVAYCSWPVAYLVNPSLANSGLASDLEMHSQPYSWLFIALDCFCGAMTVVVAKLGWSGVTALRSRLLYVALACYVGFGLATAVDALIPINCSASIASCGANLGQPNLDDLLTGLSIFVLFCSVVIVQVYAVRRLSWSATFVVCLVLIVLWSLCGLALFADHFSSQPAVFMQHMMLTMTSVIMLCVPVMIVRAERAGIDE